MKTSTESTLGRIQALLLLAPVFVLTWPFGGAILAHDVVPSATGIGFVALALIPAAVVFLVRGVLPSVRGLMFLLVAILIAMAWVSTDRLTDTFEASRVLMHWIVALVCLLIGASSTSEGRGLLARGPLVVTLALIAFAHFDRDHAFTGALGNTGNISEAALPGAIAGALWAIFGRGPVRVLGALAFVAFLTYTARVPVLAGSAACAFALALVFLAVLRAHRRAIVPTACAVALALVALATPFVVPRTAPSTVNQGVSDAIPAGPAGGALVRLLVWKSSVAMLLDQPLTGVGTGQFAARFPLYRSLDEIERTTYGRRIAEETEVEHPHNDVLAPWLDGGIFAGLAWTTFLGIAAWTAWKRLRLEDPTDLALAAGALGLLVNALVRGPLLQNPVSSALAFVLFGAVLVRAPSGMKRMSRRVVVIGSLLLLAAISPRAIAFVRHGFALQRVTVPTARPDDVGSSIAAALAACPDSVIARSTSARMAEGRGDGGPFVVEEWTRVLSLRPLRIEALMQFANRLAATDVARARAAYQSILVLDPASPGALQNLGTLELNAGRVSAGIAWFDRLPAHRAPTRMWLEQLAARLALRGIDDAADAVFARADPTHANPSAEQCLARAKESEKQGQSQELVDAWKARAHLRWAREHAAAGRFQDAVRSYRQDLHLCEIHAPAPRRVKLELAAALARAGKLADARGQADGLTATPEDMAAVPDWAREALRSGFEEAKK